MQKIDNWDKVQPADGDGRTELEPGGYICKIMEAKVVTYRGQNGDFDKLEVFIDINEGNFKGFYADDYRQQAIWGGERKWKGILRPYVPTNGDNPQAKRSQAIFKKFINAVEASNPGYHWNWDESTLKGKRVGVMFRSEEYDFKGYHGWKTRPYRFESVDFIKAGKFEAPKPKALPKSKRPSTYPAAGAAPNIGTDGARRQRPACTSGPDNSNFEEVPSDDDDLPF